MTTGTCQQIGEILGGVGDRGSFSAKRTRPCDGLNLSVTGLGRLALPVSDRQAQQLCRLSRPAKYGQGEKTLLDRRVRDTWEVPKSRVRIEQRSWRATLEGVLRQLGRDLGIGDDRELRAELHSMLVYAPGQFFLPHQDSEKADRMVGTLVVTLPSAFKGGSLVIEHQGQRASYRGSRKLLSFVAFYADCRHEVRPVKEGYRIVLSFNLSLAGDESRTFKPAASNGELVEQLAGCLRQHFETPLPPRWSTEGSLRPPPNRLVYLLDHQYTRRGLGWQHLKGKDAGRATALRQAAELYDCEIVLALAEIHESWSCHEPYDAGGWHRRHRGWRRDRGGGWVEDNPRVENPDDYELEELLASEIELTHWIDSSGEELAALTGRVGREEVGMSTPSKALAAYASEYEGYMGNYGNTMDRWYRRAAIVMWPQSRAFAVRSEASPAWALETLDQRLQAGDLDWARARAENLKTFWSRVAAEEKQKGFFGRALAVADALQDEGLAAFLLEPFRIQALTPPAVPAWVALSRRYGQEWIRDLMARWAAADRQESGTVARGWFGALPDLCVALRAGQDADRSAAEIVLRDRWAWLRGQVEGAVNIESPSSRAKAIAELAAPIGRWLQSAELADAGGLLREAVSFWLADENDALLPGLVAALRVAAPRSDRSLLESTAYGSIARVCIRRLEARLETPARDPEDWSMDLPGSCACDLCDTLRDFLADPAARQLDWPLAKKGRQHIHMTLDRHELPVLHRTRRQGRPYTLVLWKTEALFERENEARQAWQRDLEWLQGVAS